MGYAPMELGNMELEDDMETCDTCDMELGNM
jgi:hypothetical protein